MAGMAGKPAIKPAAKHRISRCRPMPAHETQASPASVTVALLTAPAALGLPHLVLTAFRAMQIISAPLFAPVRRVLVPAALEPEQILDHALLASCQFLRDQGVLSLYRGAGQQECSEQKDTPACPTALPALEGSPQVACPKPARSTLVAGLRQCNTSGTDRRILH